MAEFEVFHIEEQVKSKCNLNKRCLNKFRTLPKNYPVGASWREKEKQEHKIVDNDIMYVVTNEFADSYIENEIDGESRWDGSLILTNNNQERIAINHVRDSLFQEKAIN